MTYIAFSVQFVLVFRVSYLSNQTIDVNVTTTNYVIVNVTSSEALHEIRVTAWTGAGQGPPATFTLLTPKLSKTKILNTWFTQLQSSALWRSERTFTKSCFVIRKNIIRKRN